MSPALPARARTSGFLLLETLIALAVFAAAATVLTATFVATLELRDRAQQDDLFHSDLQTARLQLLLEPNRDDAERGGRVRTLGSGEAEWEAEIEASEVVDLFLVRLRIEFSEPPEGRERNYAESLYLLRPTWSESDERSALLEDKREALLDRRDFDRF